MALTIQDLQPQNFKVEVQGLSLDCKPPRLAHILVISKVGELFNDIKGSTREQITTAQKDFDWVIEELIPELKGINLEMQDSIDLLTQIMEHVNPAEQQELNEKGVSFKADPKVEKIG